MGISRQTPASCYVVSADILLAWNLNTKVQRHFQTANKLQDHQLSINPSWSPEERVGMAGAGEGERDDQEQKVREFNRLKRCFSRRRKPRQTYGTTDRQHLMIWVENAAFIHQGSNEAQVRQSRWRKPGQPGRWGNQWTHQIDMSGNDRRKSKESVQEKIFKWRRNKQLKEEHDTERKGLTGKITTKAFGVSRNTTFLWFPQFCLSFSSESFRWWCHLLSI